MPKNCTKNLLFLIIPCCLAIVQIKVDVCEENKCCGCIDYTKPKHIPDITCYTGRGERYRGQHNITVEGQPCLNWQVVLGNPRVANHNHCRNLPPTSDKMPWCYVGNKRFQYCDIISCDDVEKEELSPRCNQTGTKESTDGMALHNDKLLYISGGSASFELYEFQDKLMRNISQFTKMDFNETWNLCFPTHTSMHLTFASSHSNKLYLFFQAQRRMLALDYDKKTCSNVNADVYKSCITGKYRTHQMGLNPLQQMFYMNQPDTLYLVDNVGKMFCCRWNSKNQLSPCTGDTFDNKTTKICNSGTLTLVDGNGTTFQLHHAKTGDIEENTIGNNSIAISKFPALTAPLMGFRKVNDSWLGKFLNIKSINDKDICKLMNTSSRIFHVFNKNDFSACVDWIATNGNKKWNYMLEVSNINGRKQNFCLNDTCCKEILRQIDFRKGDENWTRVLIHQNTSGCFNVLGSGNNISINESLHTSVAVCEIKLVEDPVPKVVLEDIVKISNGEKIEYVDADDAQMKLGYIADTLKTDQIQDSGSLQTIVESVNAVNEVDMSNVLWEDANSMVENVITIVDNLVDQNSTHAWTNFTQSNGTEQRQTPADLLLSVESALSNILSGSSTVKHLQTNCSSGNIKIETKNVISVVKTLHGNMEDDLKLTEISKNLDIMLLKSNEVENDYNDAVVIESQFPNMVQLMSDVEAADKKEKCKTSSCDNIPSEYEYFNGTPMFSASFSKYGRHMQSGINYTMFYNSSNLPDPYVRNKKFYFECAYLTNSKEEGFNWAHSGCKVVHSDPIQQSVTCVCNHTTNFAILLQVIPPRLDYTTLKTLQVISYIGEAISILCLSMAMMVFIGFRHTLKSARMITHFHLVAALLIFHTTQLLSTISEVYKTTTLVPCFLSAFFTHFSLLSCFCWMLCEGILLYLSIVIVFHTTQIVKKLKYMLGWGVPFIIATLTLIYGLFSTPANQCYLECVGDENCKEFAYKDVQPSKPIVESCWLNSSNNLIWTMIAPVIIIILINTLILIRVLLIISQSSQKSNTHLPTTERKQDTKHLKQAVKGAFILMPILGIPWSFGLIPVRNNRAISLYIFAVLNSLQGVFILLFYCILSSEVRAAVHMFARKRRLISETSTGRHVFSDGKSSAGKIDTKTTNFSESSAKPLLKNKQDAG